jgi:hypothetical protein
MNLYVIVRRNGFASPEELQEAAARSTAEGDKDGSGVRWIRSYYEADSPESIRAHAQAAVLPVDEIVPVADTVVVRPDPQPVQA